MYVILDFGSKDSAFKRFQNHIILLVSLDVGVLGLRIFAKLKPALRVVYGSLMFSFFFAFGHGNGWSMAVPLAPAIAKSKSKAATEWMHQAKFQEICKAPLERPGI